MQRQTVCCAPAASTWTQRATMQRAIVSCVAGANSQALPGPQLQLHALIASQASTWQLRAIQTGRLACRVAWALTRPQVEAARACFVQQART